MIAKAVTVALTVLAFLSIFGGWIVVLYTHTLDLTLTTTVLALYSCACPVTFAAYYWDKRQAIRQGDRLRERTMHLLELFGGWPTAFVAQRVLRHKCKKLSYQVVYWIIVVLHGLFWLRAPIHRLIFGR
jgi:uncharacterized membrane protein YsdA (DUF1294 family)